MVWVTETKLTSTAELKMLSDSHAKAGNSVRPRMLATAIRPSAAPHQPAIDCGSGSVRNSMRYPQGGGAWLIFNKNLKINREFEDRRGVLAITVWRPECRPVGLVGLYNPPAGSTLNSSVSGNKGAWSQAVLSAAKEAVTKLMARREHLTTILITGDFNMRLGHSLGLCSADSTTARGSLFRDFLESLPRTTFRPVHGSAGQPEAFFTSRTITATSEEALGRGNAVVDVWIAPSDSILGTEDERPTVRGLPQETHWEHVPQTLSHIPVSAVVTFLPGERRGRVARQPPSIRRAPYADRRWEHEMHTPLMEWASDVTSSAHTTVDTHYERAVSALLDIGRKVFSGTADAQRTGIPDVASGDMAQLRRLRAARRAAWQQEKYCISHYAEARSRAAPAHVLAELRKERGNARKRVRSLDSTIHGVAIHAAAKLMNQQRRIDPHSWTRLRRLHFHDDPGDNSAIPIEVATTHFATTFLETRPIPPAVLHDGGIRADWLPFTPQERTPGRGAFLDKPISWPEVYQVVYPLQRELLEHITPCMPACGLCASFMGQAQAYYAGDKRVPEPPIQAPRLNMCRAAGSDGLVAEELRFVRSPVRTTRFTDRRKVCMAIAFMFNRWRVDGVPTTAGFSNSTITALLKQARAGETLDPTDPANTRGIAVGNLLPRTLECVYLARFTHWAVAEGILSTDAQAGFTPQLSAEMQVLALLQLLQTRNKRSLHTHVLFVDVKGAYDNVHRAALWAILKHAGAPAPLVDFFKTWWDSRTCVVKVGDRVSDPFPCTKGVPQGNVLSPLFWNISMEVLLRALAADHDGAAVHGDVGVRASNGRPTAEVIARIRQLAYADDICLPEEERALVQASLHTLQRWATDWGLELNFKPGKTELVSVRRTVPIPTAAAPEVATDQAPQRGPLPLTAAIRPDGTAAPLSEGTRYRYLGAMIDNGGAVQGAINAKLWTLREIDISLRFGRALHFFPMSYLLQVYKGEAMAKINYLTSVLPVSVQQARSMDCAALKSLRRILGLPRGAANALAASEVNFLPFAATILKQRVRLFWDLRLHPHQSTPAARIVLGQLADGGGAAGTFACQVRKVLDKATAPRRGGGLESADAVWNEPHRKWEVKAAVRVLARGVAYSLVRRQLVSASSPTAVSPRLQEDALRTAADAALCPPSTPQKAHIAALHCVGLLTAAHLGVDSRATPLSAVGAGGCSGSIIAHGDEACHDRVAVMRLRMGRACLAYWPFFAAAQAVGDTVADTHAGGAHTEGQVDPPNSVTVPVSSKWTGPARFAAFAAPGPCPVCDATGARDTDGGPFHLAFECSNTDMQEASAAVCAAAPSMVKSLCSDILAALDAARVTRDVHGRLVETVDMTLEGFNWKSEDGKHVLYRLLTVTPFPAVMARVAGSPTRPLLLTQAMGQLFDSVTLEARWLRRLGVKWTRQAGGHIVHLARAYRKALVAMAPLGPQVVGRVGHGVVALPKFEGQEPGWLADDDDNDDDDAVPAVDVDDADGEADYLPD